MSTPSAPQPELHDEVAFRQRFGGAVVDEEGRETPITEEMIQAACQALEHQSFIGLHGRSPAH